MVSVSATYGRAGGITPDFAARIIQQASRSESVVELEMGTVRVVLGSLIGILSLELRQGSEVTIIARGTDEAEAAEEIRRLMEG